MHSFSNLRSVLAKRDSVLIHSFLIRMQWLFCRHIKASFIRNKFPKPWADVPSLDTWKYVRLGVCELELIWAWRTVTSWKKSCFFWLQTSMCVYLHVNICDGMTFMKVWIKKRNRRSKKDGEHWFCIFFVHRFFARVFFAQTSMIVISSWFFCMQVKHTLMFIAKNIRFFLFISHGFTVHLSSSELVLIIALLIKLSLFRYS